VDGKRRQLGSQDGTTARAGEWHRIKIKHVADKIECWLDGKKLLDANDSTFPDAGMVGLWTKADAQTYFDDFSVRQE
jgi:hypothetical protein